jgi:hypothetical protein
MPYMPIKTPDCGGEGEHRGIFFLTDQCFPPTIGAGTGQCCAIIRVEYGMLNELVATFLEVMGGLRLATGSVVVVFSATHLMVEGISANAEETIVQTQRLARSFRGGVVCMPGLPIFLEDELKKESKRGQAGPGLGGVHRRRFRVQRPWRRRLQRLDEEGISPVLRQLDSFFL